MKRESEDADLEAAADLIREKALGVGYLLMGAVDGEIDPAKIADIENRLASADLVLRLEYERLAAVRAVTAELDLGEPPPGALDGVRTGLWKRIDAGEAADSPRPSSPAWRPRGGPSRREGGLEVLGEVVDQGDDGRDTLDMVVSPDGHEVHLVLCEVSGRGHPAALAAVALCSALRALLHVGMRRTDELVRALNQVFHDQMRETGCFVSGHLLRWESVEGRLTWTPFGGEGPVRCPVLGAPERLRGGGIVLGAVRDAARALPQEQVLRFERGDTLLFFSDGVTEALEQGGRAPVGELLLAWAAGRPRDEALRERVFGLLEAVRARPPRDDLMVLGLRRV